jgi:type IV secretion system protein VirD4
VPLDLHGIVEDSTNADQAWMGVPIEQKMTWTKNDPVLGSRTLAAVAQVIAANILAEFGPHQASDPFGFGRNVAQGGNQKPLVAKTSDSAVFHFRVGEQVNDVRLSGPGKAVDRHASVAGTPDAVACLAPQPADDLFQIVISNILEAPFVDIAEAGCGSLLKCRELGRFQHIPLLDKPEAIAQDLAGILIATGLDQPVDDLLVVIGQDDISRRHQKTPSIPSPHTYKAIGILCQQSPADTQFAYCRSLQVVARKAQQVMLFQLRSWTELILCRFPNPEREEAVYATKILWGQLLTVCIVVLATTWAATQWTAWRLGFQSELGAPWFEIEGWLIYPPPAFFWWWYFYDAYAPEVFVEGALIAASGGFLAIVVAIAMSVWRAREAKYAHTYGSARWATHDEIRKQGLLDPDGVVLGQLDRDYLRHNGPEHVLSFAPTRSGKGVGLVVPSLLTWPGSSIVHDIKGENWELTAGWRGRFGRVLLFDPTNVASAAYNPLLEVRRGEWEVRDVQNVADVLVDPEGSLERRNHWEKTSHALLVGAILHVLYAENDKTLAGVANFLSDPGRPIEVTLRAMMLTKHLGDAGPHPVVASAARELLNKSENERSGVLSTAMSFLGLYRDPVVAEVTSRCDWRITDLVEGKWPVTLYLVVPPSDISRTKPLIRLVLNQIGRRLTEDLHAKEKRHRLLLMLDEFPALGRLDFFESALAFMAGYGIKSFLIAQSLNQIEKAYGPNNSILDNCHVRVSFATNDERNAKRVSDSLGTATEMRAMKNYAGHRLSPWLGHLMVSRQETARALMTPGEIMQLPPTDAIVMVSGLSPIRAKKARYFSDPRLAERILSPPKAETAISRPQADDWSNLPGLAIPADKASDDVPVADAVNGGIRQEPELSWHDDVAPPQADRLSDEFDVDRDEPDDDAVRRRGADRAMRRAARQTALDPNDGIEL